MLSPSQRNQVRFRGVSLPLDNAWDKRLTDSTGRIQLQLGDFNPPFAVTTSSAVPQNILQEGYLAPWLRFGSNGEPHASDV